MEKTREENLTLRYLYGFGALFVVLSHCDGGGISMMSNWIHFGSFHLAIFAFGSGYLMNDKRLDKPVSYFAGKVKKLLIPLWLWNAFYGVVSLVMQRIGFSFGEPLTIQNLVLFPIHSDMMYILNMGSWFVFPFFVMQVIYAVLKIAADKAVNIVAGKNCQAEELQSDGSCLKTHKIMQFLICIFFVLAGLCGVYLAGHGYHEFHYYPIFRTLYFMPFYALGMLYRDYGEKLFIKLPVAARLGGCLFGALLLNTKYGRVVYAIPSSCDYPFGVAATFIAGILGILFWLTISELLSMQKKPLKLLRHIGLNTVDLMYHQFAGMMLVKCMFAVANRLFGLFADFDWNAFKSDIWYLYKPAGLQEYTFVYVCGAIAVSLAVRWVIEKMKEMSNKKTA